MEAERKTRKPGSGRKKSTLYLRGLEEARLKRFLSQARLARMTGMAQHSISELETGQRGCNPETARKLAHVLKASNAELLRPPVGDKEEIAS